MTDITLRIEKADDLRMVLELVQQLDITIVQTEVAKAGNNKKVQKKWKEYILAYKNDEPSIGDAAEWQRSERTDRELPLQQ